MVTVLELALLEDAESRPLIHTADGRTLRRECYKCRGRGFRRYTDGNFTCLRCDGRGWMPVGEAEAVVVIFEWARGMKDHDKSMDALVSLTQAIWDARWSDESLPNIVFAEAMRVAGGSVNEGRNLRTSLYCR